MRTKAPVFAGLLSLAAQTGRADPTWPAATDHMEEIVFQLQGFKGSLFNDHITPCNNEAAGPGRITASEWLRVGFHDMAPRNKYQGTNGVDASLQFELNDGENTGPGHATTLTIYANYFSSRSSMADLIAAGVYASVRSCGGPVVPLKLGRVDATEGGSGVPQPQNSLFTFQQQFDRMGFNTTEMIQLTACGHTLGDVHSPEFPDLVPASAGQIGLDSSDAAFDNKVAVEYIAGNTSNPLVVGPSVASGHNSDGRIFAADKNVTVAALTDPNTFRSVCQTVLQKMIEVVPDGVNLTAEPVAPYAVKPVDMQLTLNSGGTTFLLSGYIRVRTTQLPASSIRNVVLTWKDRDGGNACGSSGCSTTATLQGVATGFDDTFGFFPIQATIPAASGISSFTVVVNLNDGSSQSYDNNGNSYPLTDAIILQTPQSCLLQGTGALTVAALVRNDLADFPVNLGVSFLVPRNTTDGNPVPALTNATIPMTAGNCVGQYTFYTGSFNIYGGRSYNARLSVSVNSGKTVYIDDFNKASDLSGTCSSFSGGAACSNGNNTASSTSVSSATGNPSGTASGSTTSATSVPATTTTSSTSSSTSPTLGVRPTIGGYVFVSCWTEGSGVRALSQASFAYDSMTLESCAANCTGYDYWATEYGRECYCGNSLAASSAKAAAGDCSMVCAGDATEYCGAGNRLELYSTTATRSTPTPTATLAVRPTVGSYSFVGCQTEATAERALSDKSYADNGMTLESCAAYCAGFTYFGTEYGRECYCGNALNTGSVAASLSDCSMTCAGNAYEYCGAGNRLELYSLATATTSSSPSVTSSPATPTGPSIKPTVSPFTYVGCVTEGANGVRALQAASYVSGTAMTLESCASFCASYKYFGAEYSDECYCGDTLQGGSANASSPTECGMACSGNGAEYCGGPDRLSLYAQAGVVVPPAPVQPATVTVPSASGSGTVTWQWHGCYTEANGVRALAAGSAAANNMTLEGCATFCAGHAYFGAEYGRECYCGDVFGNGSVVAPGTDCSMTCAGNATEFCGAGNRLSVYSAPVGHKRRCRAV